MRPPHVIKIPKNVSLVPELAVSGEFTVKVSCIGSRSSSSSSVVESSSVVSAVDSSTEST